MVVGSCGTGRLVFFFNGTATTEIYTLSLHDALPILVAVMESSRADAAGRVYNLGNPDEHTVKDYAELVLDLDRKSTRLNSSHANISYAVFCLKKKNSLERVLRALLSWRRHLPYADHM